MTYQEILAHIYGLGRFGIRPGLARIRAILKALSDPQDALRVIHVAGTNGKGSTASFLAEILASSGYTTGLFTSPHLIAFPERIRVNGRMITETEVMAVAERVLSVAPRGATFFEIVTAMAYLHFAEQAVGPAIMEVGMGGRLDATNIADGILSVITPVALDHCEHLGDDIGRIAREKAGIIKSRRPVVTAPQSPAAGAVIGDRCNKFGCSLFTGEKDFFSAWDADGLAYQGIDWVLKGLKPGIPGRYQAVNAAVALCSAELLNRQEFSISETDAREGIRRSCWPGRMELFPGPPRLLLDGAHNPSGAAALAEALAEIPRERLILVLGVVGDKDVDGILVPLLPLADSVIAVTPAIARALPARDLAGCCLVRGRAAEEAESVAEGLKMAYTEARPDDLILVCGSLFTVGEARALVIEHDFEPFRG